MKYEINEKRLEKLVWAYLDNLNLEQDILLPGNWNLLRNGVSYMKYRKGRLVATRLELNYNFVSETSRYLGLNSDIIIPMIITWVNKNYGTKLSEGDWQWFMAWV